MKLYRGRYEHEVNVMPNNQTVNWQLGHLYQGLSFLSRIPWGALYRLVVDGQLLREEQGPTAYESREPGAIAACFAGLSTAIDHGLRCQPNEPLITEQLVLQIHKACTYHFEQSSSISGQYGHSLGFQLTKPNVTYNGLARYINDLESADYQSLRAYTDVKMTFDTQGDVEFDSLQQFREQGWSIEDIIELVKNFWETTNNDIDLIMYKANYKGLHEQFPKWMKALLTDFDQCLQRWRQNGASDQAYDFLFDVAHYIRSLNQLHPFEDGNIRTFAVVLMNYVLIQHGLPPAILDNPNIFDMHSDEELQDAIDQGMRHTLDLIEGHTQLLGYDHASLPNSLPKTDQYLTILSICQKFQAWLEAQLFVNLPDYFKQWQPCLSLFDQFIADPNIPSSFSQCKQLLDQLVNELQKAHERGELYQLTNLYQPLRELYHLAYQLNRYTSAATWQKELVHVTSLESCYWHLKCLQEEIAEQVVDKSSVQACGSFFAKPTARYNAILDQLTNELEQAYDDLNLSWAPKTTSQITNE